MTQEKTNGRKEGILRKLNTNNKLHVTVTGTQLQQELKAHNWEKKAHRITVKLSKEI